MGHFILWTFFNRAFQKIAQLDQVIQPTDKVPALSESLLALSKDLVNRIDIIWTARQQAAHHTALSRTPEADPLLLRTYSVGVSSVTLPRPPLQRSPMQSDSAMFPVYTSLGERLNLRR